MLDLIKSLIGYRCAETSKDKTSPILPPSVGRGASQALYFSKTRLTRSQNPPHPPTALTELLTPPPGDESFRIPGPKIWEIPHDLPVLFERIDDPEKYMKRSHHCLDREGEVILGCWHRVCEKCLERSERCEWCIGCRMMFRGLEFQKVSGVWGGWLRKIEVAGNCYSWKPLSYTWGEYRGGA